MRRALAYGLLASLFFAFTFIFNRSMNLDGGYWLWSAALRFILMLPIMGVIATILFFEATNMVKNTPKHLAIIEATQSGEVIFTLIGTDWRYSFSWRCNACRKRVSGHFDYSGRNGTE